MRKSVNGNGTNGATEADELIASARRDYLDAVFNDDDSLRASGWEKLMRAEAMRKRGMVVTGPERPDENPGPATTMPREPRATFVEALSRSLSISRGRRGPPG